MAGVEEVDELSIGGPPFPQPPSSTVPLDPTAKPQPLAKDYPLTTPADEPSRLSLQFKLDYLTAYFPRGIVLEDSGVILNAELKLSYLLHKDDDLRIDLYGLTFNAITSQATNADDRGGLIRYFYENDFGGGVAFTMGPLTLSPFYNIFLSPSNAFRVVQEVGLLTTFDDSKWLGPWALYPSALLQVDVGDRGTNGFKTDNHALLRLSVQPGFPIEIGSLTIPIRFPQTLALSLHDYYEDFNGKDEIFGYYKTGIATAIPLPINADYGRWTLNADFSVMFFGRTTSLYYGGETALPIGTVGIQVNF
jgi:hypothetical protein